MDNCDHTVLRLKCYCWESNASGYHQCKGFRQTYLLQQCSCFKRDSSECMGWECVWSCFLRGWCSSQQHLLPGRHGCLKSCSNYFFMHITAILLSLLVEGELATVSGGGGKSLSYLEKRCNYKQKEKHESIMRSDALLSKYLHSSHICKNKCFVCVCTCVRVQKYMVFIQGDRLSTLSFIYHLN